VALDPGSTVAGHRTVGATNWAAGYSATEHLIRLDTSGSLLSPGWRAPIQPGPIDGYRRAPAAGLVARPELVGTVTGAGRWPSGRRPALQLRHRTTASSRVRIDGARRVRRGRRLNVRIPDEVSVVRLTTWSRRSG